MTIWSTIQEEWAHQPAQITSHIWIGMLVPFMSQAIFDHWQWAFVGTIFGGIAWEIAGHYISKRKWKASIVGMITFIVGASAAALILLAVAKGPQAG